VVAAPATISGRRRLPEVSRIEALLNRPLTLPRAPPNAQAVPDLAGQAMGWRHNDVSQPLFFFQKLYNTCKFNIYFILNQKTRYNMSK
jgi:hypothetical protein